ncbi:MAG: DUF2628 domain-containing protein [Planctomycetota bacterium]
MAENLNPYAAPQVELTSSGGETEWEYLESFIGSNSHYYLNLYMAAKGDPKGDIKVGGFNIGAFFLSVFWMGYRKLYLVAALFCGFMLTEMMVEFAVLYIMGVEDTHPLWDLAFNLAVGIFLGINANRWYLAHARREVQTVLNSGLRGEAAKAELKRRGGASFLIGIGLGLLYLFAVILWGVLIMLLFLGPSVFLDP